MENKRFLFVTCQVGAEGAVKKELAGRWPDFRFAYSRPGFLTFRLPDEVPPPADFDLESVFARAYGLSLGKVSGSDPEAMARQAWELFGGVGWHGHPAGVDKHRRDASATRVRRVHAWARDGAAPGEHGFEPGITPEAVAAAEALTRNAPQPDHLAKGAADPKRPAKPGDLVLDCVLVTPEEWWIGYHRVASTPSQWPGGVFALELPGNAVSRAWLKMEEALRWSELPIPTGARVAEIGAAPGGASQALLGRGYEVMGVDPAEIHPDVLANPRFHHVRKRASQVRRREFRKTRWLTADMNVAPQYTLEAVEAIVTHPEINIRGMLLTLKLFEWELADHMGEYLERVRSWGYNVVCARQLVHNRQEICLSALQQPFRRKPAVRR